MSPDRRRRKIRLSIARLFAEQSRPDSQHPRPLPLLLAAEAEEQP